MPPRTTRSNNLWLTRYSCRTRTYTHIKIQLPLSTPQHRKLPPPPTPLTCFRVCERLSLRLFFCAAHLSRCFILLLLRRLFLPASSPHVRCVCFPIDWQTITSIPLCVCRACMYIMYYVKGRVVHKGSTWVGISVYLPFFWQARAISWNFCWNRLAQHVSKFSRLVYFDTVGDSFSGNDLFWCFWN